MTVGPDPYGGLPPYQGATPAGPPRPPIPNTVQYAFYLMLAGAVFQALGIIASLVQVGEIRDSVRDALRESDPSTTQVTIDGLVAFAVGLTIVFGLIYIALWIWMALANRAGKNYARITGSVFFGLNTLFTLIGVATAAAGSAGNNAFSAGASTVPSLVVSVIIWGIGLATVILLFNGRSSAYFKPPVSYGGYGPPMR